MSETLTGRTHQVYSEKDGPQVQEQSNMEVALERLDALDDRHRRPGIAERQLLATEACAYLLKHIAERMDAVR